MPFTQQKINRYNALQNLKATQQRAMSVLEAADNILVEQGAAKRHEAVINAMVTLIAQTDNNINNLYE